MGRNTRRTYWKLGGQVFGHRETLKGGRVVKKFQEKSVGNWLEES